MIIKFNKVWPHPASIKHLLKGHPWVTADSYSLRFLKSDFFLLAMDKKAIEPVALLLHDPDHKTIKARLWSLDLKDIHSPNYFKNELESRIKNSLNKRKELIKSKERENYYLINGENDFLPGLMVLVLKDQILIQYYAFFWKKIESLLIKTLEDVLKNEMPKYQYLDIWIQERNENQKKVIRSLKNKTSCHFNLQEFGINYCIKINEHYDLGIYTDMSSIRKNISSLLINKKSLLNLFCYTGAFSLYALKLGVKKVVSVDLSPKYLDWLNENIALNPAIDPNLHTSLCLPVEQALIKLQSAEEKFEIIICDPPSVSNDGKKTNNALKAYQLLIPKMLELLSARGSLIVFLNTHTVSFLKFQEKINQIIASSKFKNRIIIKDQFKLSDDLRPLKEFPEGNYLKGLLLELKD